MLYESLDGQCEYTTQPKGFLLTCSIMKVYITVIAVCLNLIFREILVLEIWPKMFLANQIAGFFNQLQNSKIGCISQIN